MEEIDREVFKKNHLTSRGDPAAERAQGGGGEGQLCYLGEFTAKATNHYVDESL